MERENAIKALDFVGRYAEAECKYEFECGCVLKRDQVITRKSRMLCPKHKKPLAFRIKLCVDCGVEMRIYPTRGGTMRCKKCSVQRNKLLDKYDLRLRRRVAAKIPLEIPTDDGGEETPISFEDNGASKNPCLTCKYLKIDKEFAEVCAVCTKRAAYLERTHDNYLLGRG